MFMCLWKFLTIFPEANLSDQIHVEREDLAHSLHSNSSQMSVCQVLYNLQQTDRHLQHAPAKISTPAARISLLVQL